MQHCKATTYHPMWISESLYFIVLITEP